MPLFAVNDGGGTRFYLFSSYAFFSLRIDVTNTA